MGVERRQLDCILETSSCASNTGPKQTPSHTSTKRRPLAFTVKSVSPRVFFYSVSELSLCLCSCFLFSCFTAAAKHSAFSLRFLLSQKSDPTHRTVPVAAGWHCVWARLLPLSLPLLLLPRNRPGPPLSLTPRSASHV